MNWGFPEIIVGQKSQPSFDVIEASRGLPIEPSKPHHLNPHFGGHRPTHKYPPGNFPGWNPANGPYVYQTDDTLAFGGYSGRNFLVRNVKKQ